MPFTSYKTGLLSESLCRMALRLKGYRIEAIRYRSKAGEIDIIAERGDVLAIIEVKFRPSADAAADAISLRQRRRIAAATLNFLGRNPRFVKHSVRFDVMLTSPWRWPSHITDAWRPDETSML